LLSPGQKLSPFAPSAKEKKKKPLLAPCLGLSLCLSLSCCFPFFSGSEKKRLAFCGIIQIAVCARSFSASEEFFFTVVFFVHRKKKKKKKKSSVQQQQRGAAGT
jgi:hypothetical protein